MAPGFVTSADFAIDKPSGRPCPKLSAGDFGCSIHDGLREGGFPGCAVFDCFGAGQQVIQATFGGRDWRQNPAMAGSMFTVFTVMRQLKGATLVPGRGPDVPAHRATTRGDRPCSGQNGCLVDADAEDLARFDASAHRQQVSPLLDRVSQMVRARP